MAGFEGFSYKTPQQIMAEQQQGFQAALQSGDPSRMRAATAQQAAFALGGSPELRQARKTQDVLKQAQQEVGSTGDEVEDQMAFYKAAQRAAVEAELPEIAMQATQQLATLRMVQEERARLKAGERRAESAEARAQSEEERRAESHGLDVESERSELDRKAQMVLWDPETGTSVMQFDSRDEKGLREAARQREENPNLKFVTADQVFDVDAELLLLRERMKEQAKLDEVKAKAKGTVDVIGVRKYNDAGANQLVMQQYNAQAAKLLAANPSVFTSGSSVDAWAKNIATQGRSLVDFAFKGGRDAFESAVEARLDHNQVNNAQKRAIVMNMAYALATSREGGRLTDQDIDRAIVSLGFLDNPDPRAIITVLLDNAVQGRDAWEARSNIGDMKLHSPSTYDTVSAGYSENIMILNDLLENFGGRYDFEAFQRGEQQPPPGGRQPVVTEVAPTTSGVKVIQVPDNLGAD